MTSAFINSRYEYLSHVRNINTEGMPDDLTGGDDQGLFSVVVAHRIPSVPLAEQRARPQLTIS
jgi:hypothetical protein